MPTPECTEEFEILSSIYTEIQLGLGKEDDTDSTSKVTMIMYPATANDTETQYVTLTVDFLLPNAYPHVCPQIEFRNPRGLSEKKVNELMDSLNQMGQRLLGTSMIFQMIDSIQEFLTTNNRPDSECPICLFTFTDFDVFFRTQCFHYFHSRCLGNYLQNLKTTNEKNASEENFEPLKMLCPVCRIELNDPNIDVEKFLTAPPPSEETFPDIGHLTILEEWMEKRETMTELFKKQEKQGGIIDLSEQNKRTLIISTPSAPLNSETTSPVEPSGVASQPQVESLTSATNSSTVTSHAQNPVVKDQNARFQSDNKVRDGHGHHNYSNGHTGRHRHHEHHRHHYHHKHELTHGHGHGRSQTKAATGSDHGQVQTHGSGLGNPHHHKPKVNHLTTTSVTFPETKITIKSSSSNPGKCTVNVASGSGSGPTTKNCNGGTSNAQTTSHFRRKYGQSCSNKVAQDRSQP